MRQRVRGYLDGYYVGRPHRDALQGPAGATRYRIELLLLGASTTGAYAAIWLTLALPTLLFRRLFHGILEDAAGLRGLAVALVLGQLACTASAWLAFEAGTCAPLATWALAVGLGAVFLAGLLPWRLPVAINGLAFALMLWPAGQPPTAACVAVQASETRSVHEPATPRTNPDGSWPRRPSLPAAE